jgi:hypothetical protein
LVEVTNLNDELLSRFFKVIIKPVKNLSGH